MKVRKDAKTAAWREANAEYLKAREAERYQSRRETVLANLEANRKMKLYGLTEDEVDYLRLSQYGLCAVCKRWLTRETIDHDHETGRVRGLLCPSCNARRVPVIEECLRSPELLAALVQYLAADDA